MSDARKLMKTARRRKTTKNTIKVTVVRGPRNNPRKEKIRVTRTASQPGSPPRAIIGHIKRFLFFAYTDKQGPNVVIGPEKLSDKTKTKHPVPAMHEQRKRSHAFVRRRIRGKTVKQRYPQRPYMVPAFQKNKKKLRSLYRDVIRR